MKNQNDYSEFKKVKYLYEKYQPYKRDQMIIIYKDTPTEQEISAIKDSIKDKLANENIDPDKIKIRKCHNCINSYVQLWEAPNIHSCVHADGIRAGVAPSSTTHGEDDIAYYSLNYNIPLPLERNCLSDKQLKCLIQQPISIPIDNDPIIIAVLDTGFDALNPNNKNYVWNNPKPDDVKGCYSGDIHGWNFVDNNAQIYDDNAPHWHGTLVSRFIISEFANSPKNSVQIMTLKTHNAAGEGDLFSSICAIHYAIEKGAQIINASWGFYDNRIKSLIPTHTFYLDYLITKVLREKGILFVTAAGNEMDAVDEDLTRAGVTSLRDISFNHFYPARMSDSDNNVITVTTTDGNIISPTQNYSHNFVDIGVKADLIRPDFMRFELGEIGHFVSGSSFATAIFTGKIGAYFKKDFYGSDKIKSDLLLNLQDQGLNIYTNPALENEIRKSRYVGR